MGHDERPQLAAGHLFLRARGVQAASERLVEVGVRPIVVKEDLAVLELRGGTHVVVRPHEGNGEHEAPFDFMVDDIERAQQRFTAAGFEVTSIEDGRIHRSFTATAPESFVITVNDSHAGGRPV